MTLYKTKPRKKRRLVNVDFFRSKGLSRVLIFLGGVGLGFLTSQNILPPPPSPTPQAWSGVYTESPPVRVCFSPEGKCTAGIVQAIQNAQSSIYVQAYGFTSLPIAQALVEAKNRGVDVQVLLDKSQPTARGSQLPLLVQNNIPVSIDTVSGIAHNKVIILDGLLTVTGSFNFTAAADSRNAENVLIIQDKDLARLYQDNWNHRAQLSYPYPGNL